MEKNHEIQKYQKESYHLFYIWLCCAFLVLAGYIGVEDRYSLSNAVVHIGLISFGLLELLFLLIIVTDSVYWIYGISYEWAASAGKKARKTCEWMHFGIFSAAFLVYLLYCYGPQIIQVRGNWYDAMIAAALIGIAGYISISFSYKE